jgi:GT2 family glycosyltransferase/SAM-dependent methyltransferase
VSAPFLSAVLVSWDSASVLPSALEALRRSAEAAGEEVEIVVVDNASSDDSADTAHRAGAERVIENPVNAGFASAASQGLAVAKGEWILLLNPDVIVDEDFVAAMAAAARASPPEVATLVPDLRFEARPTVINSRGIQVDEVGIPSEIQAGLEASAAPPAPEPFGGSGGASLLRSGALAEVGGFEPVFFAYLEDADLAWRLQKAGYRARAVLSATARHAGSASTGEGSTLKAYLVARNRRLLFRLHGPHTLRARGWRALAEVGHAAFHVAATRSLAPIRGRFDAFRLRGHTPMFPNGSVEGVSGLRLAPRVPLRHALRRKLATRPLMRHGPEANQWETFAASDPYWHILTGYRQEEGLAEFFASGRAEAEVILSRCDSRLSGRGTVIDIGSGVGRLALAMASAFDSVVAVDISPTMLARLDEHAEALDCANVETVLADGDWVRPADLVYSRLVFQHIESFEEIEHYARRVSRCLSPGGIAYLHFDTRPLSLSYRVRDLAPESLLPARWRRGMRRIRRGRKDVVALFERSGLELVDEWSPDSEENVFLLAPGARARGRGE